MQRNSITRNESRINHKRFAIFVTRLGIPSSPLPMERNEHKRNEQQIRTYIIF